MVRELHNTKIPDVENNPICQSSRTNNTAGCHGVGKKKKKSWKCNKNVSQMTESKI